MRELSVHLRKMTSTGWCLVYTAATLLTDDPAKVTCGSCKRMRAWREAVIRADAVAAERDRIAAGVTAMRDQARALLAPGANVVFDSVAIDAAAKDAALSAVLALIGGEQS